MFGLRDSSPVVVEDEISATRSIVLKRKFHVKRADEEATPFPSAMAWARAYYCV